MCHVTRLRSHDGEAGEHSDATLVALVSGHLDVAIFSKTGPPAANTPSVSIR